MDKRNATKLLDETFNAEFDIDRYSRFIKELFNVANIRIQDKTPYIANQYKEHISEFKKISEYKDSSRKRMEILTVKLNRMGSRDRARTMQRNFIANWLIKGDIDAALVAFYGEDPEDWRFSFVKMEYNLRKDEEGKVKITKELTPAKRYSYLVGVNELNHTCRRQFLDLVTEEDTNPKMIDIEQAFSIDNVTKKFFEKYKKLVMDLRESLDRVVEKNTIVKREFDEKSITTIDFSKKLLGQIVFIYFLQKKGWLGVAKNKDGTFKGGGTGQKKFLRKLYDGDIVKYDNFFNDILEPLFYEALAYKRYDDYYRRFNCKIPFLNGGLFETINDYDWEGTDILLDNFIFKEILDTFDRFNFTVKEDEPLEKEVAIDPEMLGKVFENLLDVKDRKSKGAFYTPREIVHYMCQQSLINYLETNTNIPIEDIEKFIQLGDFALDLKLIKENYREIDRLLKDIKIVDPAVGSGAFPIGMMNEIVKARSALTTSFDESERKNRTNYKFKRETIENSLYGVDVDSSAVDIAKLRFWLSLIVDEPNMMDIQPLPNLDHKIMCGNGLLEEFEGVKLFDEELLGEIPKDNSFELEQIDREEQKLNQELNEIYTGKKENKGRSKEIKRELGKLKRKRKKIIAGPKEDIPQSTLDEVGQKRRRESQRKLKELNRLQKRLINEPDKESKRRYRSEIDRIEWELIEETLKEEGNEEAMERLKQYKKNKSKPFFLWKLYFSDVFQRANPGFDVVIANPPYVGHKGGQKSFFQKMKKTSLGRRFNNERMDIFYYFFHIALDIGRNGAEIAFITTNYYITADSAIKLRSDFKDRSNIRKLINFNELKIFESALGQHNLITILTKRFEDSMDCEIHSTKRKEVANSQILKDILNKTDEESTYYSVKQSGLYEGTNNYIRISEGSSNDIYKINAILKRIKEDSIDLIDICNISQGIVTGLDRVTKRHIKKLPDVGLIEGEGCFVLSDNEKKQIGNSPLIKPWYKNSDISKYRTSTENKRWLIHLHTDLNLKNYMNIYNHIKKFEKIIKLRNYESGELSKAKKLGKWWALSSSRREFNFNTPKIISPQRSLSNTFGYTIDPWYASSGVHFITQKNLNFDLKYILSLLNSKFYYLWLYNKGKRKGKMLELCLTPLSEIPIKKIAHEQQQPFISIADQILSITKDDDYLDNPEKQARVKELEKEIDKLVYKLYDLTPEEIDIVENFNKEK